MLPRTPQNRTRKSSPFAMAATVARTRAACTMIPPHGTLPLRVHPALLEARAANDRSAGRRLDADLLFDARPAQGDHQRGDPGQALPGSQLRGGVPQDPSEPAGFPRWRLAAPVRRFPDAPVAVPVRADLLVPRADR